MNARSSTADHFRPSRLPSLQTSPLKDAAPEFGHSTQTLHQWMAFKACKPSSMLEILFEPPTTNLDFFPGSLLPGSRSCVPSSLIVFDLPALPRDPSGPSDLVAYLRSSTAPDSHLSPPGGSIPPENLTSAHAPL
ncbi:hypothetical protein CHARACLAT_023346 [Characodon lateralis]|uniref:Uncharacterized protein n=1 Tax=Characodon lateralis TaxID=208331 RepID=A0ABU7ELL5_9TELE|nr:hypothetical protein [Characodon lateralis]